MAVSAKWFGKAILNAFGGETAGETKAIDYLSNTIKVALFTSSATPTQDTMEVFSDLANEVTGVNYVAGGATLGSKTLGYTDGTNVIKFSGANVTWSASTITARYAVVYQSTGDADTSVLMGYVDFGQDYSSSAGDFTITWSGSGIFNITSE